MDNAIALYKLNFKVPKPPAEPIVSAESGDGKIILRWGRESEKHPLFEGYRIYRSEDNGSTWSTNYATDENGTPIAPIPYAQFDLDNAYSGVALDNALFFLGNNTGLEPIMNISASNDTTYEWIDNKVKNNYTYRYWVSAYTHGDSLEEPLETPPANDPYLENDNTVEVIPAAELATKTLDNIKVVPNPYKAAAEWEASVGERKIAFTSLPASCTLRVYNTAGELVITLNNNNNTSYIYWNLRNKNDQEVAPGLYFYHVDAGQLGTKIGKFVIIL